MNSNSMFTGDEVLEGGYGTEYDSNYTDMTYAKIDRSGSPGYLTYKTFTRKQFNLSSEDPGCIVTKLNNKQWTYTFTRIPADLEYFVWEEGELEDYESENIGEANKLTVVNNKAIITNTAPDYEVPTFGSLKISKTVVAAEDAQLESVDTTRKFSFSITLYDKDGISPYGTETYGKVVFNNGKATLRLSHGESVTIDSIPTGYTYKVDEGAIYGFVSSADSSEGTIAEDTASEVNYVNTKQPKERQNVSFKLKKAMTGSFEIAENYSFTIAFANLKKDISYRISDSKGSTVTRFTPDENKEAVVALTMTNGDEFTVNNIPEDTTYKITEAAGAYTSFYEITDAKSLGLIAKAADENTEENNELSTEVETADAGEEVTVLFTNVKNVYQDITLKKSLVNAAPGNTDKFSFLVELWGLSPEEVISTDSDAEVTADETGKGTLELTLAADEEIVIKNLPVGSTYRITEAANDYVSSYTVTDSSGGNKIVSGEDANEEEQSNLSTAVETVNEGENVTVEFINTKVPKRDLTIAKLVDMSYGTVPFSEYSQQSFSFTASFTGLEAEKHYNTILTDVFGNRTEDSITADTEGEAEFVFRLSHGGTVKILDLTEGAQYTVTEERAANYAASYGITANDTAVIAKTADNNASPNLALSTQTETVNEYDYDVRVIFTNTYEMPGYVLPDTGLDDMRPYFAIAFSFMILFAGVFSLAVLRKREEQKQ